MIERLTAEFIYARLQAVPGAVADLGGLIATAPPAQRREAVQQLVTNILHTKLDQNLAGFDWDTMALLLAPSEGVLS